MMSKETRNLVIKHFIAINEEMYDKFYGVKRLEDWNIAIDLSVITINEIIKERELFFNTLDFIDEDLKYKLEFSFMPNLNEIKKELIEYKDK